MNDVADAANPLWNIRYLTYIPLLGAAIALTFDVGYFTAIDISFFTLFSLSEHIVFAIQAFPIALIVLIPFSAVVIFWDRSSAAVPPVPRPSKPPLLAFIAALTVIVLIVLAMITWIVFQLLAAPIFVFVTMEMVITAAAILLMRASYIKQAFIVSMLVLLSVTSSFTFGYADGAQSISKNASDLSIFNTFNTQTINLKKTPSIAGRVIRSGDRGVLFYDPASDRMRFMLWEAIDSIEVTPRRQ